MGWVQGLLTQSFLPLWTLLHNNMTWLALSLPDTWMQTYVALLFLLVWLMLCFWVSTKQGWVLLELHEAGLAYIERVAITTLNWRCEEEASVVSKKHKQQQQHVGGVTAVTAASGKKSTLKKCCWLFCVREKLLLVIRIRFCMDAEDDICTKWEFVLKGGASKEGHQHIT